MTRLRAIRFLPRFHLLALAVVIIVAVTLVYANVTQADLVNAIRYQSDTNNVDGAVACIETDNPNTGSGYAYHRVIVRENSPHMFAEIGWIKGYKNANIPKVLVVYRDDSQVNHEWFYHNQYPTVGTSYDYKASHTTADYWGFYFKNMNSPIMSADMGWDIGDDAMAGGETSPNSSISIGDVDYEDVEYCKADTEAWECVCSA